MNENSKKWTRILIKAVLVILLMLVWGAAKEAHFGLGQIVLMGLMVGVIMYKPKPKPTEVQRPPDKEI